MHLQTCTQIFADLVLVTFQSRCKTLTPRRQHNMARVAAWLARSLPPSLPACLPPLLAHIPKYTITAHLLPLLRLSKYPLTAANQKIFSSKKLFNSFSCFLHRAVTQLVGISVFPFLYSRNKSSIADRSASGSATVP